LVAPLTADLEQREQMPLLTDMELPLASILIDMERAGIAINPGELAEFSLELGERILAINADVERLAERAVSIASNRQISTLLFDELGLPPGRRTKTGYSVDSEVLENLRTEHEIVPLILEHRALAKLKST